MSKKHWISVKRGLSEDPKHREKMGMSVWAFLHMIDRADWETGLVYDWRDKDEAEDMGVNERTLRDWRQRLTEQGYIACNQKQRALEITIFNWINPKDYGAGVLNPKHQGDTEGDILVSSSEIQGDTEGDTQGDTQVRRKSVTPPLDSEVKDQMPIDWKLAHGQPITQAELDTAQFKDKAQKQFEAAFQFGKLPWDSTQAWEKFSRFVCLVYRDDPQAFGNYIVWRAGDGKYSAMNNKQIRLNPQVFIDTWPEFMATAKPTKPQINEEAVEDTRRRLAEKEQGKRYVPPPDSVRARLGKLTADKSVKGGMS